MISATVMAHPKRGEWAEQLADELGCGVTWDEGWNDRHTTGLYAMRAYDPDASHHLVVQDDAILSRDFLPACEKLVTYTGEHPVGLYVGSTGPINAALEHLLLQGREGLLATEGPHWGVAILLPTAHIDDLAEWYEAKYRVKNYDRRISRWYGKQKIDCYYTAPSLVDHRHEDNPSLVKGRNGGRRAAWFIGDRSALDVDFSTVLKGPTVATFYNPQTGETKVVEPDDQWFNRYHRMSLRNPPRWIRLDPIVEDDGVSLDQSIPKVLEAVGSDVQLAQSVMEAEAARARPRSTLLESLAGIVAGSEEE